jgi:hypothetical protein
VSRTEEAVAGFAVGEQHPAGEEFVAARPLFGGGVVRKIPEAGVRIHLSVGVEARGKHGNPPLEVPVDGNPGRARVPVVAVGVAERIAVAGPVEEAAGL